MPLGKFSEAIEFENNTLHRTSTDYSYGINTRMDIMPSSSSSRGHKSDLEPILSRTSGSNKKPWLEDFIDSFKRIPVPELDPTLTPTERMNVQSAVSPLKRQLFSRHLQMIAIGGSIGAGLFIGSGTALKNGGPASVLIAWLLSGLMIYCTVQALGELAVTFPVSGSFLHFNSRFISPSWGYAMTYNYMMGWVTVVPVELVGASIVIGYWDNEINPAAWVSIFYVSIFIINFFGVRGYGEAEFVLSFIKVIAILGFIILGIVLNCGGGPNGHYIGGLYWNEPGAFSHGFKGLCSVFVTAAFSFGGTELVGLAAAETNNPRQTLPTAIKQVFWRITLFYIVSLVIIGLLVPYNDLKLEGTSSMDTKASPFVIAIQNGGIKGLPSVMNVVIMLGILSVSNSAVYASSRTILSLAEQGFAPKIFGYIDRKGRPLVGILITMAFGLLCFLAASDDEDEVFTWLLSLSGLSSIFTWASICVCHIRFRYALKIRERGTDELPFVAASGVWGSILGITIIFLIFAAQFWVALFPIGSNQADVSSFFEVWLCLPVILVFYFGYMIWHRDFTLYIRAKDIDIDTGRGMYDIEYMKEVYAEEKAYASSKPLYYRVYKFWC